jgi:hypothetical protein
MIHELKIKPEFFWKVYRGEKTFELRKDDRNPPFSVGDKVILKEYNDNQFTGYEWSGTITYILRNFPGVENDFCIFSIKPEYNLNG